MNSISVRVPVSKMAELVPVPVVSSGGGRRLGLVLSRVVVFAAVAACLLLGWGWEQVLELFAHPARTLVLVTLALFFSFSVAAALTADSGPLRPIRQVRELWFYAGLAAAVPLVLASAFFDGRVLWYLPGEDLTRYLGAAMFVAGAVLATWARRCLGPFGSSRLVVQWNHRLINTGPFARVRHPGYVGLMLMLLGLPLAFLSKAGLAGGFACVLLLVLRSFREEKLMAGELGDEWRRYASTTRRFVPGMF